MNIFTGVESQELFGGAVPPAVRLLLDQVREESSSERISSLLWTAHATAPNCLPIYYLLYKFHASRGELEQAEKAALRGLATAAEAANLPADWREVTAETADFSQPGPARFWLFTLKALAFIRVRLQQLDSAKSLLARVQRLDPQDTMGAGVVESLLRHASAAT